MCRYAYNNIDTSTQYLVVPVQYLKSRSNQMLELMGEFWRTGMFKVGARFNGHPQRATFSRGV